MAKLSIFLSLALLPLLLFAQSDNEDAAYIRAHYDKREVLIPMRDGAQLFTSIYTPKDRTKTYPILLKRTPYSCAPYGVDAFVQSFQNMNLARLGYIFVFQDVRGRYMSEGEFVDVRPFNPAKKSAGDVDEASDTYDTVDWLIGQASGNNGRVGVYGISYPGFYATMTLLAGHPAIKAVSPQAPVTDWFIGDDFHHNGAFMLMDAFGFYSGFGKPRPQPTTAGSPGFSDWGTQDNYAFYLKAGALRNYNQKYLHNGIPFWNDLMAHPDMDAWWQARNPRPHLNNIQPAVLTVGGLFDAEDCFGAWNVYKAIERQNPATCSNRIVMGPWSHGAWGRDSGTRLGNVAFGQATSEYFQKNIELPFFEFYLKDAGALKLSDASVFETGSNRWTQYDRWPPRNTEARTFRFQANGLLAERSVTDAKAADTYRSDPAKPVPYTEDVHLGRTREYMTDDQRFAARRPDVLVYETPVLSAALTVTGPLEAQLWVSIDDRGAAGPQALLDADFVVKLIDVWPDTLSGKENSVPRSGYQMLVRGEIFRGRYRNSFEKPEGFRRGEIYPVRFELPDIAHTFLPGHKMMVQVQSSWFPLADRNPQQFVNIYQAGDEAFIPVDISLWRDAAHPSGLVLPVLKP
ncbi:MAG: CocE/NonD family hydrolase [Saprospiraceae bacterium]|nr:CocE/NonD family hydrolase [Saprospiraceae bacterium]